MELSITWPGQRATDPRVTVTIREEGTPWPIRIHFLQFVDTATQDIERVNVGFEIGERYGLQEIEPPEPLDPVTIARIASRFPAYLQIAEQAAVLDQGGIQQAVRVLRGPGRKPARLNDDFYRLIGADYTQRRDSGAAAPLQDLANAHVVDKSTASRWVKTAKQRGYVKEANDAS